MRSREDLKEIARYALVKHIKKKGKPKQFEDVNFGTLDDEETAIIKEIFDRGYKPTIEVWFEDDENDLPPSLTMGSVW
jgi:hypothetical protein